MKELYKTPEITIEELIKNDVLCASNEVEDTPDNYTLFDFMMDELNEWVF